ncbi:CLUMA_CG020200, isoform A [Clunio marinus]|uniref:Protein MAK10 homolog n=1 Tax=Clunio marinus TaxID=568069 RepID=A0A1J1J489_9DIPT|nr:CLUMA_CG020200, isoform A [Clunio marinus]
MNKEQNVGKNEQGEDLKKPDYQWKDITSDFFHNVEALDLGELLHYEIFGLFEAMSAIEMMDKKMDIGMVDRKEKIPLTLEIAIQTGEIKLLDLEYSELIGIFDALFSCLVSWLEGHSPVQTIFTCLYLHDTKVIQDECLASFCNGILKLTRVIRSFITSASVYEEEDHQPDLYDFNLCNDRSDQSVVAELKYIEIELQKKLRDVNSADEEFEYISAVFNRIKYIRTLLQSLLLLFPSKSISPNELGIQEASKLLTNASESIPVIKKTIMRGTQPDLTENMPNVMGFSPMVYHRLLPPTFPRYTKIKERIDAIIYLEELCGNLKHASKVIHCSNFQSTLNFFMDFSKKKGSCLLSRSVLQVLYLPANKKVFGITSFSDILKESLKSFIAPPVLIPKNPFFNHAEVKECIDSFFFYNEHTFVTFLEICGFNRARQRDKIARLLDSFANLQDEAERVDTFLQKLLNGETSSGTCRTSFGTWVLYYCLRAMSMFLLSGLELELYSVHEYFYIFWYLYEFLFGWIISALTRADSLLFEQECISEQYKNLSRGQKKSKLKKKKMKPYGRDLMITQALQNLCGGYYKALAAFWKAKKIPQPLPEFNLERIRYEHRFAPFAELTTPPAIGYNDFCSQRNTLLIETQENLFFTAAKHFYQTKTILEHIPNLDTEANDQRFKNSKNKFYCNELIS